MELRFDRIYGIKDWFNTRESSLIMHMKNDIKM